MLTHKFASRLEARKAAHSGIVLLSSVTAHLPGAYSGVTYHASKVFVKYLAQSIAYENSSSTGKRSKIDLLCLQPGFVKTKMIKFAEEKKLDFGVVPTETCVADSLMTLGSGRVCTYGAHLHHKIFCVLTTVWKYALPIVNRDNEEI